MITPASFAAFISDINVLVGQAYNEDMVDLVANKITTTLPGGSSQWITGWTELMPKMRPWFGGRQPKQPARRTYTATYVPYESTYEVDRFILDDDQYGVLYRLLPDQARQIRRQPDYETRDLIEGNGIYAGTRQNSLDGISHWNSAHPVDFYDSSKGTYVNDFGASGTSVGGVTVGGALGEVQLATIWEYAMTIKGEDSERLGVKPDVLMHPPTMSVLVELLMKSMFFAPPTWGGFTTATSQTGAADNPLRRLGITPLMNQFLSSNSAWYLLDTHFPLKPFLWIVREAARVVPRVNENDPNVFDRHVFQWGAWDRVTPAWNFPWLSFRSGI